MKKLFSIKKQNFHKVINILGIKFKFGSLSEIIKFAANEHFNIFSGQNYNIFLWSNRHQFTSREKLWFIGHRFYKELGYFPNLKNPQSFNEKINWMKLNYNNPDEGYCTDKYKVKNYIKDKVGAGYTISTIGIYENIYDIDFENLPPKYVIKTTTGVLNKAVEIVEDKSKIDLDEIKIKFAHQMQEWNNSYYYSLSKSYKEIKPRIMIEECINNLIKESQEYEFYCFNGEPMLFSISSYNKHKRLSYYDMDLNCLPFRNSKYGSNIKKQIKLSKHFDQMVSIAKILAKDFPFVKIDFYNTEKLYIKGLIFTPEDGFIKFDSIDWDYKIGEMLDLSKLPKSSVNVIKELQTK